MKLLTNIIGVLALLGLSSTASAVVINFDSIAPGTYDETTFSSMFADVSFDNTGGSAFDVENCTLLADFTCGNAVLNSPYNTTGNSTIATFDYLVNSVSVTLGDYDQDADNLYLYAYDSSNNLIASDFFANPASSTSGHTLSVTGPNIAYVEYYGVGVNNNSVYWDNLSFNASVPEPAALGLLGIGLLGLYFTQRKKA